MGYHLLKTYGRPVKRLKRPPLRHIILHEYIKDTDTVWRDDLVEMGYNLMETALYRYTKKHGVKFIKIDEKSWEIIR